MSLVKTKIGEYDLLVESDDNTTPGSICSGRNTVKTQRKNDSFYSEIIKEAKGIIKQIANEFSDELINIQPQPREVEIEFGISLSAEMDAWILKSNGNSNLKVKIKWENTD